MKCITTIYLSCRPDLRDEWLTGSEVDDAQDALVGSYYRLRWYKQTDHGSEQAQEQALRKLVKFCKSS